MVKITIFITVRLLYPHIFFSHSLSKVNNYNIFRIPWEREAAF